jgi:hypothetical protein
MTFSGRGEGAARNPRQENRTAVIVTRTTNVETAIAPHLIHRVCRI